MMLSAFAPAKLNLDLRITGRRPNGYHLLESRVVFLNIGDVVTAEAADTLSLTITGPFAAGLSTEDNLVLRAARALSTKKGARLTLTKNLPVSSGIGGGSSDAAATLRVLSTLWGMQADAKMALSLGSDVPVCVYRQPAVITGIGEIVMPMAMPVERHFVLVNPGVPLLAKDVYAQYAAAPARHAYNDLQPAAMALAPQIEGVLQAIGAQPACLSARMSGSGATCFGIFSEERLARAAADAIGKAHPNWWVQYAGVDANET